MPPPAQSRLKHLTTKPSTWRSLPRRSVLWSWNHKISRSSGGLALCGLGIILPSDQFDLHLIHCTVVNEPRHSPTNMLRTGKLKQQENSYRGVHHVRCVET